ncbi:MAG TPA: FlgD immunoglobulin-like domain containing protein, partial [Dongiaceae bacterium]|nr:FlgD immunoglobulin-like domain containing protein [Dongiaceae bacterium]
RGTPAPGFTAGSDSTAAASALARYRFVSWGPRRAYRLALLVGEADYVSHALDAARIVPTRLTLDPSAPNPFRAATRIRFGLPHAARVNAEIFNVLGGRVATLVNQARLEPGMHAVLWDGRTASGTLAPSGVYLLRVAADGEAVSRRILLVR